MQSTLAKLRRMLAENGVFPVAYRLSGKALRLPRDLFFAKRLKAPGFRLGRAPRLTGLAHMHLGTGITAGDSFWMEAVTHFAGLEFSPVIRVGDRCSFSDRVHIAATTSVVLGDDVLCGSNVLIVDHAHGSYSGTGPQSSPDSLPNGRPLSTGREVVIGARVWIGDNVSVLPGARIGAGAVIGAHSVVTGEIPAGTVALGCPARAVRRWDAASQQWLSI